MTKDEVHIFLNEVCDLIMTNLETIEETRYDILIKKDGTPVTKSDIFIEDLVYTFIEDKFSDVVFIGEESFNHETLKSDGYVALLDPIDGTENFCSGMKEWGVSFGLWKEDTFLGGFLLMPEMDIKLLTGDVLKQKKSRILGLSSTVTEAVREKMKGPGEYRIMGCSVYNIYNVIRGSYYRFINPEGVFVWDFLPGVMLALEHGCHVTIDGEIYNGQFLNPNNKYKVDIKH